jgi:MFS family permease
VTEEKKVRRISTVYKRPIGQDVEYRAALKMPVFWLMAAISSLGFLCFNTTAFSSVYYISMGVSLETISLAMGIASAANIAFMLAMSSFIDKIEPGFIFGGIFLLFGLNQLLTAIPAGPFVVFTNTILTIVLLAGLMSIMAIIFANYFGNKAFPQIQGTALVIAGLVSSLTGIVGGLIKDATGSYSFAYILFGSIAIAASFLCTIGIGLHSLRKYKNEISPILNNINQEKEVVL